MSERRIREYERLGLLENVQRSIGGQRTYTAEHVERLLVIRRMREAQMPLADIKLSLRVLGRHALGVEAEGIRRIRALLRQLKSEVALADELAAALERRFVPQAAGAPPVTSPAPR
jgi:DNA-binding transcriptional MerR regulator